MHHHDFRSRLACLAIVFISFSAAKAQIVDEKSDESGTLVLVARTKTSVVVSVDSKITQSSEVSSYLRQKRPINPRRKLIDVGDRSACALSGNLGIENEESDVSISLRNWVFKHPHIEANKGLSGLLSAAAEAWNRRKFKPSDPLPNRRKPGYPITNVFCGGFANGKIFIVRGRTVVDINSSARFEDIPPYAGDLLYLEGVLATGVFLPIVVDPKRHPNTTPQDLKLHQDVIQDIRSNVGANNALSAWYENSFQAEICRRQQGSEYAPNCPPPRWLISQVKDLFTALFESVERRVPIEVASPNNARVIEACGRFPTTVEAKHWDFCRTSSTHERSNVLKK
jgi:hypothetical protein